MGHYYASIGENNENPHVNMHVIMMMTGKIDEKIHRVLENHGYKLEPKYPKVYDGETCFEAVDGLYTLEQANEILMLMKKYTTDRHYQASCFVKKNLPGLKLINSENVLSLMRQ